MGSKARLGIRGSGRISLRELSLKAQCMCFLNCETGVVFHGFSFEITISNFCSLEMGVGFDRQFKYHRPVDFGVVPIIFGQTEKRVYLQMAGKTMKDREYARKKSRSSK